MWAPLLDALVPARCGICTRPGASPLCGGCRRELRRAPTAGAYRIAGLESAWAAFQHAGVARRIVSAAKFQGRLGLLDLAVAEMAERLPPEWLAGTVFVPVPADPWRSRRRGFDTATRIAGRLEALGGSEAVTGLERRKGAPQARKRRAQRLATSFEIRAARPLPARVTLVDDVATTGATLRACADAARAAGAAEVNAVTLTRAVAYP